MFCLNKSFLSRPQCSLIYDTCTCILYYNDFLTEYELYKEGTIHSNWYCLGFLLLQSIYPFQVYCIHGKMTLYNTVNNSYKYVNKYATGEDMPEDIRFLLVSIYYII